MTTKPPYTITEKAADYLAKIVEAVTRLEYGTSFKRDIRLHRKNRVQTIYSSLAIEGNNLSEAEVTAVLDGKAVAGKQADIKEVTNAYEAYDKCMSFDPYSIHDFLLAHRLLTEGLVEESVLYENRPQYYQAMQKAKRANDAGDFIEFALWALLETIHKQESENVPQNVPQNKLSAQERQSEIIKLLKADPHLSRNDLAVRLDVSIKTIARDIEKLKEAQLIQYIGGAKDGYWNAK